jgi:hypothetical protein
LFLFGFGIISGRFLTLLFMLFLSARLAVVHLGKIAFHGLPILFTGENFRKETAQAKLNGLKELLK